MTFSLWSLDFIYYPVSGIMWVWHKVFGFLFGLFGDTNAYANPWTWVLSVMFLVFTLRAIMFKPFMKQMDSSLKMQAIQPEMKRLREKYKDDRQRLTEEMMKLNKEAGVNPLASCLPALLQAPAFIGLFHVLRNFIISYSGGPKVVDGSPINNYFFPVSDVKSFHDALLFGGASLSAHLTMPATSTDPDVTSLADLGSNRETMLWVGIPLMILAAIATHLSSRKSVARQKTLGTATTGGQQAIMQKLMLYGFPLGVLFIGSFYPIALLFYWLSNNFWTFGQLAVAHRIQDKKLAAEAQVVEAAKESTTFSKPKPGAKPVRGARPTSARGTITPSPIGPDKGEGDLGDPGAGRGGASGSTGGSAAGSGKGGSAAGSGGGKSGGSGGAGKTARPTGGSGHVVLNGEFLPPPGAAPRPGARPGGRPKKKKQRRG